VSVQDRGTDGIDLTGLEDIPVIPGLLPSGAERSLLAQEAIKPFSCVRTALLVVGAKDFLGKELSLSLGDEEFSGWNWVMSIECSLAIFVWTSGSLESVVFEQILSEFIDWWNAVLSGITLEGLWDSSLIWINPVSEFVLSSWELFHVWSPSTPRLSLLEDLVGLDKVFFLFFVFRVTLLQEFHLNEEFVLVGSLHDGEAFSDIHEAEQSRDCHKLRIFHFY